MLILGLETSTRQVGVALAETSDDGVALLASATMARPARHAESLVPAVDFVCRGAGVRPDQLGALAVGIGPGLFTGLRVGIATAQAMALALGVPVVGVSSLDVVAHGVLAARGVLLVAMDARRGELFWAAYDMDPAGTPRRRGPDRAAPPEEVAAAAARLGAGVVVGDGPDRYPAVFAGLCGGAAVGLLGGIAALPSPVALVELGARALLAGQGGPPEALAPIYVREPDAVRWPRARATADTDRGVAPAEPEPAAPALDASLRAAPAADGPRRAAPTGDEPGPPVAVAGSVQAVRRSA